MKQRGRGTVYAQDPTHPIVDGAHGGLLDTAEPYGGQGVRVPEEIMFGALPRNGWDGAQDAKIRTIAVVEPLATDPLRERNREYLYEMGTVMGHEGFDWQNPYVWASRGVLAYPNENSSGMETGVGGVGLGQTPADVLMNVRSTSHALLV